MQNVVSDVIEREMVMKAPRAEVWAALTTPEGLSGWWGEDAELELRRGGRFRWNAGEEYGTFAGTVVEVEPLELFAFTWRPFQREPEAAAAGDLTTRVEFRLEDHANGTLLRLRESGFAALPGVLAAKTLHENQSGWDEVLSGLRTHLRTGEKMRWV